MSGVARETQGVEIGDPAVAVARETQALDRPGLLSRLLIAPIRVYQRFLSPLMGPRCRYYPTCSSYAVDALRELGPVRGTIVAAWRIMRCNPFSAGGLDPLSERRLFNPDTHRHAAHATHHLHGGAR